MMCLLTANYLGAQKSRVQKARRVPGDSILGANFKSWKFAVRKKGRSKNGPERAFIPRPAEAQESTPARRRLRKSAPLALLLGAPGYGDFGYLDD